MNRRELLREMSRVQATWVNRNTPGTGDVSIAAEDEQDYLTRIAAVFERAREDVRRKRGRPVTASQASAAIGAMLLAFDPNQRRDPDGKWGDGVPGPPTLSRKDDPLGLSDRIRLKSGETLRGSDRVRAEGGDGDALLAAIAGPDGPQLRFGVIPSWDAKKWAASDRGATARFDGADVDRVATELAAVSDAAKKAQVDFRTLGKQLDDEGVWWDDDANLTPDQIDRRTAYEALRDDGVFTEGVIPGSGWGDIHWTIRGDDVGESGNEEVLVSFLVRPSGERDMSWDEMRDGAADSWSPAIYGVSGAARLSRSAAKMATASQSAVTAAVSMSFDPDQPRDREGKWTSGGMGGVGVLSDSDTWAAQAADPGSVTGDDLIRIGAEIGRILSRDGASMADPAALFRATTEAVAADDADITARQYVRAMDRDYGTSLDKAIINALAASDIPEDQVAGQPQVAPVSSPSGPERVSPPEWSPDFSDSVEDRRRKLQEGIDSGIVDADNLAGGDIAETVRFDWKDGSKSVLKAANRTVRHGITPKDQTDAEELAGLVGNAIGVRAPVTQRISENEIYLEYMPGQSAMQKLRGTSSYRFTNSEQGLNMGLLDHLIGNPDRHDGNWTIDDDGNIHAIDHGLAFTERDTGMTFGPFAFELFYGGHKIPRARLDEVRSKLKELQPEFKRLRRREWYEQMLERLDELQSRIGGE